MTRVAAKLVISLGWRKYLAGMLVGLFASLALVALCVSVPATAQSSASLPQQKPIAFLSVPYHGSERVNAYFDHNFPTYWVNGTIEIYNGWIATNAITCTTRAYLHVGSGTCLYYDGHPGYDFDLDYEPVLAPADGQVIDARWWNWNDRSDNLGLFLGIDHGNGYKTYYGHLSAASVLTNYTVYQGQIIGTSGDTGNSTGRHLHFEVRLNDTPTDPFGGSNSHWLWVDGAWTGNWANHFWGTQAVPRYATALIVDDDNPQQIGDPNDDPNFTKGHTVPQSEACPPGNCPYWYRDPTVGHDNDMLYTYSNGNVTNYWAYWVPPQPGLYDVQVFVPRQNATTWSARYCLMWSYNYMPLDCMLVDQNGTADRWLSLGVHKFGTYPSAPWFGLRVSDATGEGGDAHGIQACPDVIQGQHWCSIGVDAVRFRPLLWLVYLPSVLKNR